MLRAVIVLSCAANAAAIYRISTVTHMAGGNCDGTNINQYNANSGKFSAHQWGLDPYNAGWRWCGLNLHQCHDDCVRLGNCKEVFLANNGCCFPKKTAPATCPMTSTGHGGHRYAVHVSNWVTGTGGNCDHANTHQYTAASGKAHHASWFHDPNAGWRWCGMALQACKDACLKLGGCKAVYHTPNNCCYPHKTNSVCHGTPGGPGGHKYVVEMISGHLVGADDEEVTVDDINEAVGADSPALAAFGKAATAALCAMGVVSATWGAVLVARRVRRTHSSREDTGEDASRKLTLDASHEEAVVEELE
mmetsp:Transcript_109888/g.276472  ORF Transcript_109888/g.276472 Transcript_109888/m.276472 type:complete len:305 (-) Transcript_109888:122-1036(-)